MWTHIHTTGRTIALAFVVAALGSGVRSGAEETLKVWQFRGVSPGKTTDRAVLADDRWGEPFDRGALASGQETWHYPLQGDEAILVIEKNVVQVVDVKLREGTALEDVLAAFRLRRADGSSGLPPAAKVGLPIPSDWQATPVEGARIVVFVDPTPPTPQARLLRFYARDAAAASIQNSLGMKLVLIPAGSFRMGSTESGAELEGAFQVPSGRFSDEQPAHAVNIARPFYMAAHETTVGQFRRFVDETKHTMKPQGAATARLTDKAEFAGGTWLKPGFAQSDKNPVVSVSWEDATAFCRWLSKKEGKTYRLPTEAEWEYACRAGTTSRFQFGDDPRGLVKVGNVLDLAAKRTYPQWPGALDANDGHVHTSPVGTFAPNRFGLYDMHGNVWEWCQDWYDAKYYAKSPASDPIGPARGDRRLFRGGCWY